MNIDITKMATYHSGYQVWFTHGNHQYCTRVFGTHDLDEIKDQLKEWITSVGPYYRALVNEDNVPDCITGKRGALKVTYPMGENGLRMHLRHGKHFNNIQEFLDRVHEKQEEHRQNREQAKKDKKNKHKAIKQWKEGKK